MPITTTPSGGPQGEFTTYTPIYSQTISSATATVTFSNIPQTYTDIVIIMNVKMDTLNQYPRIRFNSDTSSSYGDRTLYGNGSSAVAGVDTSVSGSGYIMAATYVGTSDFDWNCRLELLNYSNTTNHKTFLVRANRSAVGVDLVYGLWRKTEPISRIDLVANSGNYSAGSTFTLYGIKAAASQFIPTKASGGDIFASDGTYAYHAFTSTGIFVPQVSLTADVLVVAGGGAGGGSGGGGGGAGGIIAFASQSLSAGSYNTCTVGAGGAGGFNQTLVGGTASQFGALTAAGAGGGGVGQSGNVAGGTSGTPTSFAGGSGNATGVPDGGGGGAGGAGGNATSSSGGTGGAGGAGLSTVTNWGSLSAALTALGLGVSGQIGGGGGGGGGKSGTTGPGGAATAGGGNGGLGNNAGNGGTGGVGLPGTGGGGGGGGIASVTDGPGGAGGSGVIIVRYAL